MNNTIKLDFEPRTQKFVMTCGFHLLDVMRAFPSRRFDPKTKAWKMPIVKQNILHLKEIANKYTWETTSAAQDALRDFEKLTAGPVYLPFPRDFFEGKKYQPLAHQWDMLDKGWNLEAFALVAAMGTGKTFVEVNKAARRFMEGKINRVVIICPEAVRVVWAREFEKYVPGLADCRELSSTDRGYATWCQEPSKQLKVLLVSVEGLGISPKLAELPFQFIHGHKVSIIADEASRIKNPAAARTAAAIALSEPCQFSTFLNGTPIAKGIHDLWAQYEFIDPNIIGAGDYWAFKTRYVVMGGYENKQIIGYSNVEELMNLISPYTLEVDKRVLNLPPKVYKQRTIKPTPEQNRLFDKILTGVGEGPMIKTENVLERMLRLQQVIGGFEPMTDPETLETTVRPLAKNPKFNDLMEFIGDNFHDSKFIIWARYVPEIEFIAQSLRQKYGDSAVGTYYGGTSSEERDTAEDRYRDDPAFRFIVANPAAAGLGLTFISSENDLMYYYSGTFAYIDRMQSEDRGHRIGQTSTVVVADAVMEGTLDEAIVASIREKKDMDQFVKDWIASGRKVADLMRGHLDS